MSVDGKKEIGHIKCWIPYLKCYIHIQNLKRKKNDYYNTNPSSCKVEIFFKFSFSKIIFLLMALNCKILIFLFFFFEAKINFKSFLRILGRTHFRQHNSYAKYTFKFFVGVPIFVKRCYEAPKVFSTQRSL